MKELYCPLKSDDRSEKVEEAATGLLTTVLSLGAIPKSIRWVKGDTRTGFLGSGNWLTIQLHWLTFYSRQMIVSN